MVKKYGISRAHFYRGMWFKRFVIAGRRCMYFGPVYIYWPAKY